MAKKGIVMEINIKKNHLSRIRAYSIMILFAMCLTMNVFFYSTYNLYELLDKTIVIDTGAISESIVINEDSDNNAFVNASLLNKNNSNYETITKNISSILMIEAIPKGISLFFFLLQLFFLSLFILLPDGWTLINQKVRLDN